MMRALTKAEGEAAFKEAEASLRLEGLKSSPHFESLKTRVLDGEITTEQAKTESLAHYRSNARVVIRKREREFARG